MKKTFPNFWQAWLIIALWAITNVILFEITGILLEHNNYSTLFQCIQAIVWALYFVPFIIYLIKKTNIQIWDYLALPKLETLFKLIIVSLLVRFIISLPFDKPVDFFKLLMDSKLRFYSIKYDSKIPGVVTGLWWIFIPIMEEVLYRGLILRQFLKQYSPTKAILLSSLIFSFSHLNQLGFIALFIYGIILGMFYYKTNSILVSSIAHYILDVGLILKFENLDLNLANSIVYISIFLISILTVIYILRKPLNTFKLSETKRNNLE